MKKGILFTVVLFCCLQFSYGQAGQLDSSFGKNGIMIPVRMQLPFESYVTLLAQADNSFFVIINLGESGSDICKRKSDGSIDSSYGHNGFSRIVSMYSTAATLQPDGKIVLAGSRNSRFFAVARFNTNGNRYSSFAIDGIQITHLGAPGIYNYAKSITIQPDGKILLGGYTAENDYSDLAMARYNTNGTLDNSFSGDGMQTAVFGNLYNEIRFIHVNSKGKIVVVGNSSLGRYNSDGNPDSTFNGTGIQETGFDGVTTVFQDNDKIVVAGSEYKDDDYKFAVVRYNADGSADNSFSGDGKQITDIGDKYDGVASAAIQNDGKIVVGGFTADLGNSIPVLVRYYTDGSLDSIFSNDGIQMVPQNGAVEIMALANNKLYATGRTIQGDSILNFIARYLLDDETQFPPSVRIAAPLSTATLLAPANVHLVAEAVDLNGSITEVSFYNGSALVSTVNQYPYIFTWYKVPVGNYTLTAKATDNSSNVTTSAPVHISVVRNKPPAIILTTVNGVNFTAPATIIFAASAEDSDGRITKVEFYNGDTLLRTERKLPYTYHWPNVPAGTYTITAVATDNYGAKTTSNTITVKVTSSNEIVVNKPYLENQKIALNDALSLRLSPNPANNIVNIYTTGLQPNKPATISVISISGIVLKTIDIRGSMQTIPIHVSSLASGEYIIKIITGDKVLYKQFVKL